MWEDMQRDGYFQNHPHYQDHFGVAPTAAESELDASLLALDFTSDDITMPIPYSDELERSVKRTESEWLYKMFPLPRRGLAYDIGCGFGRSLQWMSGVYDEVIGSDISATVITQARQNLKNTPNLRLYVNSADSLPEEIEPRSVDVAYIFTAFQHIPRDYAQRLLTQLRPLLAPAGKVVFNLLTNINESLEDGAINTEWSIGYSHGQASQLLEMAGFKPLRLVTWSRPETTVRWLWVFAEKRGGGI